MNTQETQEKIQEQIKKNPGIHLSKIAEDLNIKITEVETQLQHLENIGKIRSTVLAGYKRYYILDKNEKNYSKQKLQTRNDILKLISNRPGLYLNKIAELLDMSIQLVDYHISVLIKNKQIIGMSPPTGEHYTRYFTVESNISGQEKIILEILANKIPLEVVLLLVQHNVLKHKEIHNSLGILPSKLSYHLNKLVNSGIIEAQAQGKDKGYLLLNKNEIIRILRKYRLKIELNVAIEEFFGTWQDLNYEE